MKSIFAFLVLFFCTTSFSPKVEEEKDVKYTLSLEARGCHYQISLNGETLDEGKTYQKIDKTFELNQKLNEDEEQIINVNMNRISREMPLNTTGAYVHLKLEKTENDSVILSKEINLPTFPYNNDEEQPASIGGTIRFEK